MIKKHYSGMERRAENIIWNTAGRYDFDPPFMAFLENGNPDQYFNMILGLTVRWMDMEKLESFFARYAGHHKADEFDALLWLGIENCIYEKELPHRPVLAKLRRERAELFFRYQQTLSRQQMMLQSMLVYTQQEARWREVLGEKEGVLSPREKSLASDLRYPGDLDTDGLIRRMEETLKTFFRYTVPEEGEREDPKKQSGLRGRILKKLLKRQDQYRDTLLVRNGTAEGDEQGSGQITRAAGDRKSVRDYETDLLYIRRSLGESIISDKELRTLENNLCVKTHAKCRLWVTDGQKKAAGESAQAPGPSGRDARDLERVLKDAGEQAGKNAAWMKERAQLVASGIRKLTARVDEVLSGYERALPDRSRAGSLEADVAWRLPVLNDPDVFLRAGDETERSVSVDLLLDASASRLNYQEQLAGEAYIIAKAFMAARVPVQVETFRSLRGFTVLQILKDRRSRDCSHILDYFAGGWNRDGLGLRMSESFLPEKQDASVRILLVLTDASPNDSTGAPPEDGSFLEREYQGRTAVLDTRDAVADLRAEGVYTAAIFLGPTLYLENLHTIYGSSCVRIHRIEQLEEGVSDLLEMLLRKSRG